jgi:hypothetical protein
MIHGIEYSGLRMLASESPENHIITRTVMWTFQVLFPLLLCLSVDSFLRSEANFYCHSSSKQTSVTSVNSQHLESCF